MIDLVIWLSIAAFLLLSYYLSIFIFQKNHIRKHVLFWLCFHTLFTFIVLFYKIHIWTVPFILLIIYLMYFIATYLFCVRDMWAKQERQNFEEIIQSKWMLVVFVVLDVFITLVLVVDVSLLVNNIYIE